LKFGRLRPDSFSNSGSSLGGLALEVFLPGSVSKVASCRPSTSLSDAVIRVDAGCLAEPSGSGLVGIWFSHATSCLGENARSLRSAHIVRSDGDLQFAENRT
jgi:hypothetical protein